MIIPAEERGRDPSTGVWTYCPVKCLGIIYSSYVLRGSNTVSKPSSSTKGEFGSRTAHRRLATFQYSSGEKRMAALEKTTRQTTYLDNPVRIREHLANERTFL